MLVLIQHGNSDSALNLKLDESHGVQALARRINDSLKTCKYCSAFESELDRVVALREKTAPETF